MFWQLFPFPLLSLGLLTPRDSCGTYNNNNNNNNALLTLTTKRHIYMTSDNYSNLRNTYA